MTTTAALGLLTVALAVFRLWRLAAEDVILDKPRDWLLQTKQPAGAPVYYGRPKLAEFVGCPWCLGFWMSLAAFASWHWWSETDTVLISIPLALSTLVGLVAKIEE